MQTFYGSCYDLEGSKTSKYQFYAEIKTLSQDPDANKSRVSIALKARRNPDQAYANSAYNLMNQVTVTLIVDGQEVYKTTKADIDTRNGRVWTFTTQEVEAQHNADGSKTIHIAASFFGADVSSLDRGDLEADAELPSIARSSAIVSVMDVFLGNPCNIKFIPGDREYYYRVSFSLKDWNGQSELFRPGVTTEYTYRGYVIPLEVADFMQTAKETMTATLYTYSDNRGTAQLGQESATFTVQIPAGSEFSPKVEMTLAPVPAFGGNLTGLYIQGVSRVQAVITAQGQNGVGIASKYMKIGKKIFPEENGLLSDYLTMAGVVRVYGYAEDSKGVPGSTLQTIQVQAYEKPRILPYSGENAVIAARCDADGNMVDGGSYLRIRARRGYTAMFGRNRCAIRYRYTGDGGNYSGWHTILSAENAADEVDTGPILGALSATMSYKVQVQAIDDVGQTAETIIDVPTETVHTHETKNGIGFGKMVEGENLMDVGWDAHFHGEVRIGEKTLREYILQIMSEGA